VAQVKVDGEKVKYIDEKGKERELRSKRVDKEPETRAGPSLWIEGEDLFFMNVDGEVREVIEPKETTEL